MYDIDELRQFIKDGLPEEDILNKGSGGVTRILSEFIDNELIKDSLKEIRSSILVDELSPCQRMVLLLLTYS